MSKRLPKFCPAHLKFLVDGYVRRWNVLKSNINSDSHVKAKENAWEDIERVVNGVKTSSVRRKTVKNDKTVDGRFE